MSLHVLRKFALNIAIDPAWADAPPTEICLLKAGKTDTENGPYEFTDVSAKLVMNEFRRRGILYFADWHHASLDEHPMNPRLASAAACHYKLEVRNGDLYACEIKWTPDGLDDLKNKRVLYISPAFDTNKRGEVVSFRNFALTNDPATHNIDQLVAAESAHEGKMTEEEYEKKLKKLEEENKALEAKLEEAKKPAKDAKRAEEAPNGDDDDDDDDDDDKSRKEERQAYNDEIVRLHIELARARSGRTGDLNARVMAAHKKGLLPKASIQWALSNGEAFDSYMSQVKDVAPVQPAADTDVATRTNTRAPSSDAVKLCKQLDVSIDELAAQGIE